MGWVYLDDGFFDHPKAVAAGGDAVLLYLAGIAYCKRKNTGGRIHRDMVPRLTDRKNPVRLAVTLTDVGLWEADGDTFVIHDWADWNREDNRSDRARKAARARWGISKPDAQAMHTHPPSITSSNANGTTTGNARAPATTDAKPMLGDALVSSPQSHVSKSLLTVNDPSIGPSGDVEVKNPRPQPPTDLVARLRAVCHGQSPSIVQLEAIAVAAWARDHVDDRIIDEAIGYCATAKKPPDLPRAVAAVIRSKAADHGIHLSEFVPVTRKASDG
jgi:hypothetical protein